MSSLEADRYAQVTALDRMTLRAMLALWGVLDPGNLQRSFENDAMLGMILALSTAQVEAASIGAGYIDKQAVNLAIPPGPRIVPAAFGGLAADGRDLQAVVVAPLVRTMTRMAQGFTRPLAMQAGRHLLETSVVSEIHDAARSAESVAIMANAEIAGYVRFAEPGACSRCIILAGRFYKWNKGFDRHPRCRCNHIPQTTETEPQSSREIFAGMSREQQDKTFGKDGAEAIRRGADVAQVVNARLGISTATVGGRRVRTTTLGTSKRSNTAYVRRAIANERGEKVRRQPRLLPEEILNQAGDNRTEARRLLISNGYIVGDIAALAREAVGK